MPIETLESLREHLQWAIALEHASTVAPARTRYARRAHPPWWAADRVVRVGRRSRRPGGPLRASSVVDL
jgi:hypothetical protein